MFLRVIVSGLLVCSLVGVEMASAAEAASRDVAKGRTAQGYRIKLAMRSGHSFKILHFKADLKCRDGSILQLDESGFQPTIVKRNGSFREVQYGSTDKVFIRGRVKGRKVTGKLRLTDRYGKRNPCKSRWIKFRAK